MHYVPLGLAKIPVVGSKKTLGKVLPARLSWLSFWLVLSLESCHSLGCASNSNIACSSSQQKKFQVCLTHLTLP